MSLDLVKAAVWEIMDRFADEDFDGVIHRCVSTRGMTSDVLRAVIRDYGRKLTRPPANAYDDLDAIPVTVARAPTWAVSAPLCTEEEGRSDLEVRLTVTVKDNVASVELEDVLVP
jgi:hypothetical protein